MIKYRLHSKDGPVKIPIQKIRFPSVALPLKNLDLDNWTRGSWLIWRIKRYPRSFLNRHHMTSSWTHAERKNVMRVAVYLFTFIEEMDEW